MWWAQLKKPMSIQSMSNQKAATTNNSNSSHLKPLAHSSHLQPLAASHTCSTCSHFAATCSQQPLAAICAQQPPEATCSHLKPLAAAARPLAAICSQQPLAEPLEQPLAATCSTGSGCKWLQVAASKWLLGASGCFLKKNLRAQCKFGRTLFTGFS